jgi:putative redox protein
MKIELRGTPDFHFEAKNPENGYTFSIGASKSIGGDESGFRPMQILLTALGSCSGIDVVNILKKSRVEFDAIEIEVDGDRKQGATPSPFTHIRAVFRVRGKNVDKAKVEKAVSLSIEKYCSVVASLDPAIKIETVTEISE